jgi:hypothetical protein
MRPKSDRVGEVNAGAVGVGWVQIDQAVTHEIGEWFCGVEPVTPTLVIGYHSVQVIYRVGNMV